MKVFVLLLVTLVAIHLVVCQAQSSLFRFNRLHEDSVVTFDSAPILTTTSLSWLRCVHLCHINSGCQALIWDSSSVECNLFDTLQVDTVTSSPGTTTEVYAKRLDTFVIKVAGTWLEAQARCQAMGAVLHYPNDRLWIKNRKIAEGVNGFFIGGQRSDENSPWYDQENNLLPDNEIDWSPNAVFGPNEHCMAAWGTLGAIKCDGTRDLATLCKTLEN